MYCRKRRVPGLAAQSLFTALLLAAAGLRRVRTFHRHALTDENGDLFVLRRERTGEHATTHLPPGTEEKPPDDGSPDPDEPA